MHDGSISERRRKEKPSKNALNQNLVESPTKTQLYQLDELYYHFKTKIGSAENSFIISVIWMIIIRVANSLFTLGYSEQNTELYKNILSNFEVKDFIDEESLYIYSSMAISLITFMSGKKILDYYRPLGWITSKIFGKNFEPESIRLAYENRAKAEELIKALDGKLSEVELKQGIYFGFTFIINRLLNLSSLNSFTTIVPLNAFYEVARVAWLSYQNRIDKSKEIIAQQKELLDSIVSPLSKLNWQSKESNLNFELVINNSKKIKDISNRKVKATLIQAIKSIKPNYRIYADTDGILLANANLTENEAQQIKDKFSTGMANIANYAEAKKASKAFLRELINVSENRDQVISWYMEDMPDTSATNNTMPKIVSTVLDNWPVADRDSAVAEIQKIIGTGLTIKLQDNRLYITKFPNLTGRQWSELKEYFSKIAVSIKAAKAEQTIAKTDMPQASNNTQQQQNSTAGNIARDYIEKAGRYISSLSQFFAAKAASADNKNLPVVMPPARKFSEYNNISDYNPDQDYKETLRKFGKVTIPFFHDRKLVGFIKLTKDIYNLPDGGSYAFSLIDDHLKQGGGHFIPLRNDSKYATQCNATHKLKIFGKTGGDPRGLLKLVKPNGSSKEDVRVYDFDILDKHLRY